MITKSRPLSRTASLQFKKMIFTFYPRNTAEPFFLIWRCNWSTLGINTSFSRREMESTLPDKVDKPWNVAFSSTGVTLSKVWWGTRWETQLCSKISYENSSRTRMQIILETMQQIHRIMCHDDGGDLIQRIEAWESHRMTFQDYLWSQAVQWRHREILNAQNGKQIIL